nr:MAG TPA: hypothetical protein [Caudoviricetes sp.]
MKKIFFGDVKFRSPKLERFKIKKSLVTRDLLDLLDCLDY